MKKRIFIIGLFVLLFTAGMVYSEEPTNCCGEGGKACCQGAEYCEYDKDHERLVNGFWQCCEQNGMYTGRICENSPPPNPN